MHTLQLQPGEGDGQASVALRAAIDTALKRSDTGALAALRDCINSHAEAAAGSEALREARQLRDRL
eukprot:17983-Prymnesium_polylepis.1